jgi:hypothetical protein
MTKSQIIEILNKKVDSIEGITFDELADEILALPIEMPLGTEIYKKVYIKSEKDLPKESGLYYAHYRDVFISSDKILDNRIGRIIWFDLRPNVTWVNWDTQVEWYLQPITQPNEEEIIKRNK